MESARCLFFLVLILSQFVNELFGRKHVTISITQDFFFKSILFRTEDKDTAILTPNQQLYADFFIHIFIHNPVFSSFLFSLFV